MKVRIRTHEGPFEAQLDYSHGPEPVVAANGKLYDQVNFWGGSVIVEDATAEELEALKKAGYFPKKKPDPRDERIDQCRKLIDQSFWEVNKIHSLAWASGHLLRHSDGTECFDRVSDLLDILCGVAEDLSKNLEQGYLKQGRYSAQDSREVV